MGAIFSSLRDGYMALVMVFKTIASMNRDYQEAIARTKKPPPGPSANPTKPYWHRDPPFPDLVDIQHDVPETADVVIIGSGITGAAAARTLVELSPKPLRIVVVEARQICSGATGRNGGHIKCGPHEMFSTLQTVIGKKRAAEVTRFQMRHLEMLKQVGEHIPEADVREVETVDFFVQENEFEKIKKHIREAKEWLPEFECDIWEAEAAREKVSRSSFGASTHVKGAVSFKAGAMWPYRLVTGIWNDLLKKQPNNVSISTHTMVEAVTVDPRATRYTQRVKTSRGTINARHVLHATNGYAPCLVPSLTSCLSGFTGTMTAQRPGEGFPVQNPERSWGIAHDPDFEYITQLTPDEKKGEKQGLLMVGGAFTRSQQQGLDTVGTWDDSIQSDPLVHMFLGGCMETVFEGWGKGGGIVSSWTGILGMTGDQMPLVGRLDAKRRDNHTPAEDTVAPGQWICAGYSGEGMVLAWLSATAVAIMMLGLDDKEIEGGNGMPGGKLKDWFPKEEFGLDEARLRRAQLTRLMERL
ncbi:FAD dependent oxidoreductase domain-containing protein [Sarocladium implicatum]|nr:FAD dependent oxidoreductase domain-containing protein [Sarocladium implicatum]